MRPRVLGLTAAPAELRRNQSIEQMLKKLNALEHNLDAQVGRE